MNMAYRINGFDQIKAFYSIVFEQKYDIRPQHISLYVFLINQNNRNNWVEWFKCPFDLAMAGACIGNKKTYYKCLSDLQDWGLIKYEKGINDYKAPKIKIEVLNCTAIDTATVPQSEPLLQPQGTPLPTPQDTHIYKQETIKQETKQQSIFEFDDFWKMYGKSADKKTCTAKYAKLTEAERTDIKNKLPLYLDTIKDKKYQKNPLTYINGKCWNDIEDLPIVSYDFSKQIVNDGVIKF